MSINIKKYTKEQMTKMVEEAQEEAGKAAAYEKQWRVQVEQLEDQVRTLKQRNVVLTESIEQMNGEAINKANEIANLEADADALRGKLADTEAALGRANAELGAAEGALGEMNDKLLQSETCAKALQETASKLWDKAAAELGRADYAENHPFRNLWAWIKRKLGCKHD